MPEQLGRKEVPDMLTLASAGAAAAATTTAPAVGLIAAAIGLKVLSEISENEQDHRNSDG